MPAPGTVPGLTLTVAEKIATLTIDRPAKKNALSAEMWAGLSTLAAGIAASGDARVLIVRGAGSDFSAGADIGEFDTIRRDAGTARTYEAANSAAFAAIRNLPIPTIAAIRGVCLGGGFGIAAACDIRIAAENAIFAVPAARLGLAYPQHAMADIVHACGPQFARLLTFSGASVTAAAAFAAGFLAEIVPDDELDARAAALAARIAANAPLSVRASKAAIRAVLTGAGEDAEEARRLGEATFSSADYAEGRTAFRERRQPRFTGR
jgi:enoyl-CoA hydratase/carnithine racemase